MLAEGAIAIQRGVLWVATNSDATLPSARGPLPGNGSLVAALRQATGATPVVTGKPEPTMHRETVERSGARHPIVVGDRLDTDVEGARAVGCPSLLVLTGVTTPALLLEAPERLRPDYIAADLGGLLVAHPEPIVDRAGAHCGAWSASRDGAVLTLRAATPGQRPIDRRRARCAAGLVRGRLDLVGRRPHGAGRRSGRRRQRGTCRAQPGVMSSDLCRSAQHGTAPVGGSSL